jgi:hypothetical protein
MAYDIKPLSSSSASNMLQFAESSLNLPTMARFMAKQFKFCRDIDTILQLICLAKKMGFTQLLS